MNRTQAGHWLLDDADRANFAYRVLQDAWLDASRTYWLRRARELENARPRLTDHNGAATPEDLTARWDRLTAQAKACRARAGLDDISATEFDHALEDIARGAAA